jgi:predicted alpha/beta-hydrolase family hydrolase
MGGRIASQVVAAGVEVHGLALFAYPLHPPGRPEKRRHEHFDRINVPVLFCSGTKDSFAAPEELIAASRLIPKSTSRFLDGADHGFKVAKASGRTIDDVWSEAALALVEFLSALESQKQRQPSSA